MHKIIRCGAGPKATPTYAPTPERGSLFVVTLAAFKGDVCSNTGHITFIRNTRFVYDSLIFQKGDVFVFIGLATEGPHPGYTGVVFINGSTYLVDMKDIELFAAEVKR